MSNYGPYEGPTMKDFDEDAKSNQSGWGKSFKKGALEGLSKGIETAGKAFLDDFVGSGQANRDKYQSAMTSKEGSKGFSGSTSTGGMSNDLTIVHHPGSSYSPFVIPGEAPREGIGSKLAKTAAIAGIGALTGGLGAAALGGGAAAGGAAASGAIGKAALGGAISSGGQSLAGLFM